VLQPRFRGKTNAHLWGRFLVRQRGTMDLVRVAAISLMFTAASTQVCISDPLILSDSEWSTCEKDKDCTLITGPCPGHQWVAVDTAHERDAIQWVRDRGSEIDCAIPPSRSPKLGPVCHEKVCSATMEEKGMGRRSLPNQRLQRTRASGPRR
jgi:hypothetical protein